MRRLGRRGHGGWRPNSAIPLAAALAAAARRRAYWGPGHLERRLADSTQLLRAAREAGDIDLTLQGHAWLVVDLLEAGDRAAVEAQIEAFTVGARQLRQPLFTWQAAVWRAMRALLAGHLSTADRLAGEALSAGIRAEGITAPQYYSIQLLAIRREQDRLAELEDPVRELVKNNPHRPAWRAVLGPAAERVRAPRGGAGRARGAGRRAASPTSLVDGDWMIAMTHPGRRGRRPRRPRVGGPCVYELLLPVPQHERGHRDRRRVPGLDGPVPRAPGPGQWATRHGA